MNQTIVKKISFSIIITIILTSLSLAAEPVSNNLVTGELQSFIIKQEVQTRGELKDYIDRKIDEQDKNFEDKGQNFIDKNFAQLDSRVHNLANLMLIKMSLGIITSMIIGGVLLYMMKRKLDAIKSRKKTILERKTPEELMKTAPLPPKNLRTKDPEDEVTYEVNTY